MSAALHVAQGVGADVWSNKAGSRQNIQRAGLYATCSHDTRDRRRYYWTVLIDPDFFFYGLAVVDDFGDLVEVRQ